MVQGHLPETVLQRGPLPPRCHPKGPLNCPVQYHLCWGPLPLAISVVQGHLPELFCRPPAIVLASFQKRAVKSPYYHFCWGPLPPAISSRRPSSLVDFGTCSPSPLQECRHLLIQGHLPETALQATHINNPRRSLRIGKRRVQNPLSESHPTAVIVVVRRSRRIARLLSSVHPRLYCPSIHPQGLSQDWGFVYCWSLVTLSLKVQPPHY